MAPLSHDLADVILPHDHFGDHIDSSGKTIDKDLQKKNFFHAAEFYLGFGQKQLLMPNQWNVKSFC